MAHNNGEDLIYISFGTVLSSYVYLFVFVFVCCIPCWERGGSFPQWYLSFLSRIPFQLLSCTLYSLSMLNDSRPFLISRRIYSAALAFAYIKIKHTKATKNRNPLRLYASRPLQVQYFFCVFWGCFLRDFILNVQRLALTLCRAHHSFIFFPARLGCGGRMAKCSTERNQRTRQGTN